MPPSALTPLPSLPAGYRWKIKYKRAWAFLTLEKDTWYGHRVLVKSSLNPQGLGMDKALASAANDILYSNRLK